MSSIAQVGAVDSGPSRGAALRRLAAAVRCSAAALEAAAEALLVVADEPEPAAPADDQMLTVEEAAQELRRSPRHVRTQCRSGAIKALRDGHGYRIRRSALRLYERRRSA